MDKNSLENKQAEKISVHKRGEKNKNMVFILRNLLNTIFIIGAIVGMVYYFFASGDAYTRNRRINKIRRNSHNTEVSCYGGCSFIPVS